MQEVIDIGTPEAEAEMLLCESDVKNRIKFGALVTVVALAVAAMFWTVITVNAWF